MFQPHPSPETEIFSTPPTTPGQPIHQVRPSLSRRSSRPSSLHIDQATWASDIVVGDTSPNCAQEHSNTPRIQDVPLPLPSGGGASPAHNLPKVLHSPCFVHSHLDKGASLTEWLRNKQHVVNGPTEVGVAKSLQNLNNSAPSDPLYTGRISPPDSVAVETDEEYETDYSASLTHQLAETAIGVREMSKQLGRTRVRTNIQTVLIVTKARDNRLIKLTRELALYLMLKHRPGQKRGLVVYVDNQLRHSRRFDADGIRRDHPELFIPTPQRRTSSSASISSLASPDGVKEEPPSEDSGQLRYWTSSMCIQSPHLFDFVVTLGGDGTVLFTSWLFQRIVPPVLSFALGSLGFLTNFDFADYQAVMDSAIDSGIRVNLRMRFTCTVYRAVSTMEGKCRKAVKKAETGEIMMKNVEEGGWEALEGGWSGGFSMGDGNGKCGGRDKEIMCFTTRPSETFEVLNDLVVDRGPSPYVSLLELFGDEHHMTTVQADGLTVSTPTGSTAYSLSAGGSLVHPEIPSILITPICPHTLSFRPMLLPDSMELRICVPYNSRSTAWASFDGRGRVELKQGDHVKITASKYPFPTVCADKQSTDWFHSISRTLKWNERERQKSFVVVEEASPVKPKKRVRRSDTISDRPKIGGSDAVEEHIDEEDEVSDEEEEGFDIDDSSPESALSASLTVQEQLIGREKTYDNMMGGTFQKAVTTSAVKAERRRKSRSRSRSSVRSGVETPNRFAGPQPHIPPRSPRHVEFVPLPHVLPGSELARSEHQGEKGDSYFSRLGGARRRHGRNGNVEGENADTPKPSTLTHSSLAHARPRGPSHRSRSMDHPSGRRAFAVWGNDETDSNASDSSADS